MLLVSIRSEEEARAAVAGGASIIDVKEPRRGSLGMAESALWGRIRAAIPESIPLSVALGELAEWTGNAIASVSAEHWRGVAFRKVGLAASGPSWRERWKVLREQIHAAHHAEAIATSGWVAVAYLDWEIAQAPDPDSVINEAAGIERCAWVLFDTWDKSRSVEVGEKALRWIKRAKAAGRSVALAGSLDEAAIRRLRSSGADMFAVRGAACRGGDRDATIDVERVARLVAAAAG
ncbi:MAG: (5-formylfuran-3-yl)methyl phosphate synthase [Isosphaeraceae bacterium]